MTSESAPPLDTERKQPESGQPAPVALPEPCACFALRRAARALSRHYDRILAPRGLRTTQFSALMAVNVRGPMTVSALAELVVADRTTLTRNLGVLEARGLVRLDPGHDRRQRLVSITDQGVQALRRALPLWSKAQAEVRQGMGGERLAPFLDTLGELTDLFGPGGTKPAP